MTTTTTYSPRLGIELQGDGEDVDSWGEVLNANLVRIEEAINGVLSIAVSGTVTLVQALDTTDQSHFGVINVTGGSGGTVILPLLQGVHIARNGTPGDVTFINAATANAVGTTLHANCVTTIFNDGVSSVYQVGFGGSLKDYVDNIATSSKAYTDAAAIAASNAQFPGQSGNAGKYFQTNGSTPSWVQPSVSDITGLQAAINSIKGFAIATAALL